MCIVNYAWNFFNFIAKIFKTKCENEKFGRHDINDSFSVPVPLFFFLGTNNSCGIVDSKVLALSGIVSPLNGGFPGSHLVAWT